MAQVIPLKPLIKTPASFLEMIFDRKKRQETYDYYDSKYEETEVEKEIFEAWKDRRLRKGE